MQWVVLPTRLPSLGRGAHGSSVNAWFLRTLLRASLTDLISVSSTPSLWLACGVFHCHSKLRMNSFEREPCILRLSQFGITSLRYSCAPMNFEPHSDEQTFRWPRNETNRRDSIRKASDDLLVMSSK